MVRRGKYVNFPSLGPLRPQPDNRTASARSGDGLEKMPALLGGSSQEAELWRSSAGPSPLPGCRGHQACLVFLPTMLQVPLDKRRGKKSLRRLWMWWPLTIQVIQGQGGAPPFLSLVSVLLWALLECTLIPLVFPGVAFTFPTN